MCGGVPEDVDARLGEPSQIWIAPADLPYVHVFVTPSASHRSMIRGPLPDPLMSSGSSTRTVHDLSAWAALSIEFAGLLARGDGAATGGHPPQQLLAAVAIADALGVIFTQFACLGHEASHRQVPASPTSDDLSATGGFVALPRA